MPPHSLHHEVHVLDQPLHLSTFYLLNPSQLQLSFPMKLPFASPDPRSHQAWETKPQLKKKIHWLLGIHLFDPLELPPNAHIPSAVSQAGSTFAWLFAVVREKWTTPQMAAHFTGTLSARKFFLTWKYQTNENTGNKISQGSGDRTWW